MKNKINIKTALTLFAILFTANSFADDWRNIYSDATETDSANYSTYITNGVNVAVTLRADFTSTQHDGGKDYNIRLNDVQINCMENTVTVRATALFDKSGSRIAYSNEVLFNRAIPPGSSWEHDKEKLCPKN